MFRRKKAAHPPEQPPHEMPEHPGWKRRSPRPGHSLSLYIFAIIGVAAVCFLLIRYLIIPLLVIIA